MSTILQILASSAVMVVIIEVVFQSKTNRVRFLTNSRAEWRSNLKQYAEELSKSKKHNISQVLTKIKMNLNGYGCYNQDEYPSDVKLDFFRDEHIWREINFIEVECEKKHPSKKNIEKHKQRLIRFLSLLLKFDWERSKEEIKMNLMAIASVVAFTIMTVTCLIQIPFVTEGVLLTFDIIKKITILTLPFFILLSPYLAETIKFIKNKKWYRYFARYPLMWVFGTYAQYIVLLIFQNKYKIEITVPAIFYLIAVILAGIYPIIRRKMFIDYDNAIMKIDSLIIYAMNSQINDMRALVFFLNHETNSQLEYRKEVILNDPDFKRYIEELPNKKVLLRCFSSIRYSMKKEKVKDVLAFIMEKPKRCKMIVKFKTKKPESVAKFSVGFKKKEWGEWIQ